MLCKAFPFICEDAFFFFPFFQPFSRLGRKKDNLFPHLLVQVFVAFFFSFEAELSLREAPFSPFLASSRFFPSLP